MVYCHPHNCVDGDLDSVNETLDLGLCCNLIPQAFNHTAVFQQSGRLVNEGHHVLIVVSNAPITGSCDANGPLQALVLRFPAFKDDNQRIPCSTAIIHGLVSRS